MAIPISKLTPFSAANTNRISKTTIEQTSVYLAFSINQFFKTFIYAQPHTPHTRYIFLPNKSRQASYVKSSDESRKIRAKGTGRSYIEESRRK